jgi:hypothetical protein
MARRGVFFALTTDQAEAVLSATDDEGRAVIFTVDQ